MLLGFVLQDRPVEDTDLVFTLFQLILNQKLPTREAVCADSRPRRTWSEIRNQLLRAARIMIVDGQIRLWLRRKTIQINARDRPLAETV
jgi:hypothetical protein